MISTVLEIKPSEMASQIFIESMDKQLCVLGLFFDITKAYNVINHEILLNKLEYYGVRGTTKHMDGILYFVLVTIC